MSDRGSVRALVDTEGRLVHADEALLQLNARAGGAIGRPLALAPLAAIARLVVRLGVPITRPVTLGDHDADIDTWLRAAPAPDGVALALAGWRERATWAPSRAEPIEGPGGADDCWECDAGLRLTRLAAGAAERFGLSPAALLGKPLTQAFHLAEDEAGDLPILSAIGLRRGFTGQRATVRRGGAAVYLRARPRFDATGDFAGFAGEVAPGAPKRDAALSEGFTRRLERALRLPLGRIVASADLIHAQQEGPLRPDYVDYAADIASAGRHLIGLIDDLADLQAIERADFAVAAEPVDLADVARRAAGLLGVRASDAGVRIDRPGADERLPVVGEFRRALQVLVNLIANALRYSPRGGMVWVRAEQENGLAMIIVADQGKGVAAEDHERIFERFERVDRSEPGGSGLGLYIARRLARAMGGDLTVDSAPGQGARFVFALPLAPDGVA